MLIQLQVSTRQSCWHFPSLPHARHSSLFTNGQVQTGHATNSSRHLSYAILVHRPCYPFPQLVRSDHGLRWWHIWLCLLRHDPLLSPSQQVSQKSCTPVVTAANILSLPPYWRELKKYHLAHHFADYENGFGVTSRFWDRIFGTELITPAPKILKTT